jgi:hypothetical protein
MKTAGRSGALTGTGAGLRSVGEEPHDLGGRARCHGPVALAGPQAHPLRIPATAAAALIGRVALFAYR